MGSYALPRPDVRRKIRLLLLTLVTGVLGVVTALVAPPSAQGRREHARRRRGAERPLLRRRHCREQAERLDVRDDRGP